MKGTDPMKCLRGINLLGCMGVFLISQGAGQAQAPGFEWVSQASLPICCGGGDFSQPGDVTVSGLTNIYVTGAYRRLAVFGTTGKVGWARSAGTGGDPNSRSFGNSLAADRDGNIYVTGTFINTVVFGPFSPTGTTRNSTYLAKYDSAGTVLWV